MQLRTKSLGTLFPYEIQSGKIKLDISIDDSNNRISSFITADPKSLTPDIYHEGDSIPLSIDGIEKLFHRIEFRIKDDLLKRSKDPNYFTTIVINFSHDEILKLNLVSKITTQTAINEILALAKQEALVVANEISSKKPLCSIV